MVTGDHDYERRARLSMRPGCRIGNAATRRSGLTAFFPGIKLKRKWNRYHNCAFYAASLRLAQRQCGFSDDRASLGGGGLISLLNSARTFSLTRTKHREQLILPTKIFVPSGVYLQ